MAGRAYLYGLGAAGERGVDRVLDWFHADVVRTMSLLGAGTIADLDRSLLDLPDGPMTVRRRLADAEPAPRGDPAACQGGKGAGADA